MVLMNDFRTQWEDTREDVLGAVRKVGESGWYITGTELRDFERALAATWDLPYCSGVASGLDAVEISLKALGCKPGDRVLTTPLSAFATTLAIVKLGAVPVFVDTDAFGLIDLDLCEELLKQRPYIRFLVPVHLYGNSLNLGKLRRLKQDFDLTIVEDCAQSILATSDGSKAGSVGQLAATSFYPTKNLGAMGDGGAVLTADERLHRQVQSLRDYGQSSKYRHDFIGYNSRLDELQAAILHRAYLRRLPSWTARRRAIAAGYLTGISNPAIHVVGSPLGSQSCYHLFPLLVAAERKSFFTQHLRESGIASGEHYPLIIPDQKAMCGISSEMLGDCARARQFASREVSLPIHPYMSDEQVDRVIQACNAWRNSDSVCVN
jgi:dTDP-3-amino-3,4,6-trideoxy-alpha-D-glucose transaminase